MFAPTKPFSIYQYRSYSGYQYRQPITSGQGEVLCVGNCDLASMRPTLDLPFNWFEWLSQHHHCDQIGQVLPLALFVESINWYIQKINVPKSICFVAPILAEEAMIGDELFTVTENSPRVIRFLLKKGVIDTAKAQELQLISNRCKDSTDEEKVIYFEKHFKTLNSLTQKYNIRLFWCFNGTKTSNHFFKPIFNQIIERCAGHGQFVGWVENIDTQPDSSIGPETQKFIFEQFRKNLNDQN